MGGCGDKFAQEAGLSLAVDCTETLVPAFVGQANVRFAPDKVILSGTPVGGTAEPEKLMGLEKLLV